MTRQKKELWKKIEQIDEAQECDEGFGYWTPEMQTPFDKLRDPIYEELARLSHFSSAEEMLYDIYRRCS